jgi:hypothetical protein
MLQLSEKWAPILLSQPETGMDYQIVSIFLRDGRRFDRVTIVGGMITNIAGNKDTPFQEEEITEIKVTHEK